MPNLVGIGLSQVPTNSMLGGLAYQDPEHASIKNLDLKNLSQINSEIADTAVDVFVYDTSKDSDGGSWRKRTQNTSWYNETLETATRGTRKEFPAVAVIVAESNPNRITIYDGDDPDLPMWMVFTASTSATANFLTVAGQPLSSVAMLNGELCIGFPSANGWGVGRISFVEDSQKWCWTSATVFYQKANTVAERNVENSYVAGHAFDGLVNALVNDVAMTVLPNAPIDSATGLPVPTIAVGTAGGVSVIKDDGTVVDIVGHSIYKICKELSFTDDDKIAYTADSGTGRRSFRVDSIPSSDFVVTSNQLTKGNGEEFYVSADYGLSNGDLAFSKESSAQINDLAKRNVAHNTGLSLIEKEDGGPRHAFVTSSFNTGWMHGDIKGAFLSDTDTTDKTNGQTDPDRSVENNTVTVIGTVTKSAVATGAELVAYSGFTASNYMYYNASDMAFGTGDFSISVWCIPSTDTTNEFILELDNASTSNRFYILTTATATKKLYTPWNNNITGSELTPGEWNHVVIGRQSGTGFVYVNGKKIAAGSVAWTTALNGNGNGTISNYSAGISNNYAWSGSLALLRISGSSPSAEQVKKMYNDEKHLFHENSKATLYGSSDAVTALAHDEVTDQLHVGTSSGRSDFQGLCRINNTTTAVTTAISAHDEFIIEQ